MSNKKGISDVVTTVLLILLAVIAVAAVAYFIYPMVSRSGETLQQTEACLTASLEVVNCNATSTTVTVKRNAGAANIQEIRLIFEQDSGETTVVADSSVPGELGTNVYSKSLDFTAKSVSVAAGIADAKGNINYCNPTEPVNCR